MNYSTAIFLINKHVRAISATYEAEESAKRTIFKTLDPDIQVGDFVIVQTDTRHKMTVVKVVEVDVDVDFESPIHMLWVVDKINVAHHTQTISQEARAIQVIKSAELAKKRDDLRESMLKNHLDTIKALPIAALNGDTPKE